jgi:hypothetical protein
MHILYKGDYMKGSHFLFLIYFLVITSGNATMNTSDTENRKCFLGTSLFVLANLIPQKNPPNFMQLNGGYHLTSKDVLSIEAITWKYNAPLGIPYGPSFDDPDEGYSGYVRDFGIGIVYQRFIWKGMYTSIHILPMLQNYVDENKNKIQNGFMLFLTLRTGYHIKMFKNRFFIEPSFAFNFWPIRTNVPSAFSSIDNKWPKYFLFDPGIHCGFEF